jgi:hypothetical protein
VLISSSAVLCLLLSTTQLVILFVFLCLSRFGLWSFDLCETQLMQESVAPAEAGVLNGAQESLVNVFGIVGFLLTMIFSDPRLFAAPAWISFVAVITAAVCYTTYASNVLGTENPFPALATFDPRQKIIAAEEALPVAHNHQPEHGAPIESTDEIGGQEAYPAHLAYGDQEYEEYDNHAPSAVVY